MLYEALRAIPNIDLDYVGSVFVAASVTGCSESLLQILPQSDNIEVSASSQGMGLRNIAPIHMLREARGLVDRSSRECVRQVLTTRHYGRLKTTSAIRSGVRARCGAAE